MLSVWLLALGGGCGGAPTPAPAPSPVGPPPAVGQPPGWADVLRTPEAVDKNPDPRVVEIDLVAKVASLSIYPGTTTPVWTYDGALPGRLIRARVGDRLIVNFTNELPEPTSIHWHGLRIPVAMDGVPDHPVPPIASGRSFRYDFTVPDAGLFWYHPHFHSARQVGDGLYGGLLVEDPAEPTGLGDELVMVLSDMELLPDGSKVPPDSGGNIATLFGREGNALLVNGKHRPTLRARVGLRQRWRVVNAAKSRYFQLAAEGQRFVRIGGDGGAMSEPVEVERPVLIPGERADLIWEPRGAPGETIPLRWVPYDRGYGSTFNRPEVAIVSLELSADQPVSPAALPEVRRSIPPLDLSGATPVHVRFTRNDLDGKFALGINGQPFAAHEPFTARVGETQLFTIDNEIDWAHPFHLHGFFFQVLDELGKPRHPVEWKDTVDVPVKKTTRVAVRYDDRPGMWMFHCHILDHADAGMMALIHVR